MRRIYIFSTLAIAFSLLAIGAFLYHTPSPDERVREKEDGAFQRSLHLVTSVIDGDTIQIETEKEEETIRLIGVDAPEYAQCWGEESATYLRSRIDQSYVYILNDPLTKERDAYDRLLRYVITRSEEDIGSLLLQQGHAQLYSAESFSQKFEYRAYEAEAQKTQKGLWGECILDN